jgi:hypothetical protein
MTLLCRQSFSDKRVRPGAVLYTVDELEENPDFDPVENNEFTAVKLYFLR